MTRKHSDQPAKKRKAGRAEPPAAKLIRSKVERLYAKEPDAFQELAEAEETRHRSKHQQYMHDLSHSGKDLATIQTEWHNYYASLPANEKHQVWQEFYASQSLITGKAPDHHDLAEHKQHAAKPPRSKGPRLRDARSAGDIQSAIRHKVSAGGKLQTKHHLQSLFFGLGMGLVVLIIFLFSFFNEVFIAPFIQPGRTSADAPLIVNDSTVAASSTPEVIIPKINVQIPVDYNQTSIREEDIQSGLENGVVHYPTTAVPGQNGNAAIFGHSSNNIFNKGKYKFAFVLLHKLEMGDTFYLTYNGKVYAYKVFSKTVVEPHEVGVLGPVAGKAATATLITCDPPGTTLRRLVIVGEQVSPQPSENSAAPASTAVSFDNDNRPAALPGNGQTLWGRFISTVWGKIIVTLVCAAAAVFILRWLNRGIVRAIS